MKSRQCILLVDDQPANLVALKTALQSLEVDLVEATNGNDALTATLHNDFAAAILDVQMPGMDGYELAEILRSEPRTQGLPILFITAVNRDEHQVFRGYQAGAVDFLPKPIQQEVLLNKLHFFLLLDSQRQALLDKLELQASESSLQSILASMNESVLVSTPSGIATLNPAAEELLGYEPDELLGSSLTKMLSRPPSEMSFTVEYDDLNIRHKSGRLIPIRARLTALKDREGVLFMFSDLTEKKESMKAQEELKSQLLHSQRLESLGRLAGGVAHDLNNLLTVIQTCCSLALDEAGDANIVRQELSQGLAASQKGEILVRELLAIGRKQVLQPETINLPAHLRETCSLLNRLLGDRIELTENHSNEEIYTQVDPAQLNQVVMNLGVNARDAMPNGGRLSITSDLFLDYSGQKMARIRVRDTGTGIPEKVKVKMFEPFFTTKADQGTGLGLAVVHGIVSQSGGKISVETEKDKGTCFTILLEISEKPLEPISLVQPKSATGSGTILLVEDDVIVQRGLKRVLQRSGFSVLTAGSLKEALAISEQRPQLKALVTDINLPDEDGVHVAFAVREIFPELPVLFMSGNPGELLERQVIPEGQVTFLQKPFVPQLFIEKVVETCSPKIEAGSSH